jgi:hypothetical protein
VTELRGDGVRLSAIPDDDDETALLIEVENVDQGQAGIVLTLDDVRDLRDALDRHLTDWTPREDPTP